MFKPLNQRVLIRPDAAEEVTASGIILAGKKEKPATGEIIVGCDIAPKGSKVLFSKFAYDEVTLDKTLYYLVAETSLLGIFE